MLKRTLTVVLMLVTTVVGVEVVLQSVSYGIWLSHRRRAEPGRSGGRVVLCLGDSYTFGIGASDPDHSYPARLENRLRQRLGPDWSVVNGGWPGRNSRELLEGLDDLLVRHRPRFVCILIGINDRWTRPAELVLSSEPGKGAADDRFRWRPRTLRLLSLILAGRPAEAVSTNPDAHYDAIRDCLVAGDRECVRRELEELRRLHRDEPAQWPAEALAGALQLMGREDEAFELARDQLQRYPESARLWLILAQQSARTGDHESARQAVDRSLELSSTGPGARAFAWRTRATIVGGRNPQLVAESLILAWLDDGDEGKAIQAFQIHQQVLDGSALGRACRSLGLTADQAAEVLALHARATAGADRALYVLDSHLRQAVGRCRALGAEPLLVTYPWPGAFGEPVIRSVAQDLGVATIAVHEAFTEALSSDPGLELFVTDGHCNDRGYDLVAETVARSFAARLVEGGMGAAG